jgi:polysaccharide deacetylase family protein (PEP-CTERM system associated)
VNAITPLARPPATGPIGNGLSLDVEAWFQVGAFEDVIARDSWAGLGDRVDRNVKEILALFDEAEVKATFFTLGWVAQRHGPLLREIAARGHELASHGWDHRRVFTMDRAEFADDIARARKAIEDGAGTRVTGYRAPSFSIDRRTPWAFMELAQQGYA